MLLPRSRSSYPRVHVSSPVWLVHRGWFLEEEKEVITSTNVQTLVYHQKRYRPLSSALDANIPGRFTPGSSALSTHAVHPKYRLSRSSYAEAQ